MQKKGQMTLLIILGIIVVASVILIYTFRANIFGSEWETQQALSLSVPDEAEELHSYIGECIEEVVEEPVRRMGQQGGYLDIPSDTIGRGDHNPFSNSLEIFPGTDFETVYWFYIAANGVQQSQIPDLETMEEVLGEYVNNNLAECLDDTEIYEENNATVGSVQTEVEILNDEVRFTVNYPVTIELDDFSFEFESFYQEVDMPLGEMLETAIEIMNEENENFYLEELTVDMLVLYDEVPFSWTEFDCDQEAWSEEEVESSLKEIIMNNILAIKVSGSDYYQSEESDEDYFEWDALSGANDYNINLLYSENWPFKMQVYPTEDGELVEDSFTQGSPLGSLLSTFFCMNNYHFVYDIKYPVLISLYDEETDFTFQFATMVALDNNAARENELDGDLNEVEDTICQDATTEITVYPVEVAESGALVDLDEVEISFQCINNVCPLGETRGSGLVAEVPACVNAQIVASKEGYNDGIEIVTTLEESTVTVTLETLYEIEYELRVVDAEEGTTREATSEDTIIVTMTDEETGYAVSLINPNEDNLIKLSAGTYKIEGSLVSEVDFDIEIPESSYTSCTSNPLMSLGGLFGLESDASCVDVDTEGFELQSAMSGGVDQEWTVDRDDLARASMLTIYVTSPGVPENYDDLDSISAYLDTKIGQVEPELT